MARDSFTHSPSHYKKNFSRNQKTIIFLFTVRQPLSEMPLFGKKKTVEQQMREQDREMRRVNRGLERDRGQLDKGSISQIYFKNSKNCSLGKILIHPSYKKITIL